MERLIQPSRSKRRQMASNGYENKLRTVRICEETAKALNDYLFTERPSAENERGIISDWLFLNLRGKSAGRPLAYHNYRKLLRNCAAHCGISSVNVRTHSGRSTKVMEVLEQKLGDRFFRSHRGFLVNLQEVARYDNSNIELKNGESVFLAKQKYNDFVTAYMKYLRKV